MQIRFFEPADLESMADLLTDMSGHYNGAEASSRETVRAHLATRILGPGSGVRLVVAVDAGRVCGMAAISLLYPAPKERGQLFMKELYVHSGLRGRDIGERLMCWVARHAIEQDCVRLDWTAEAGNPGALRFYRRLGARRVGEKIYFRFAGDALRRFADDGDRRSEGAAAAACRDVGPAALVSSFELRRLPDGVVHRFRRMAGATDSARFACDGRSDLRIEYDDAAGWVARDPATGVVTARPWADEWRHHPGQPAEGEWVSREGPTAHLHVLRHVPQGEAE